MKSLAIVSTHPIQYYSPIFRLLAKQEDLKVKVYYDHIPNAKMQGAEFSHPYEWDVDLLSGYEYAIGKAGAGELFEGLKDGRYSALLLNGWHAPYLWRTGMEAILTHTPLMVRGDSHLMTPRSTLKRLIKDPIYHAFFSRVSACLAVGTWNSQYFEYYGVPKSRIFSSPHCVDNDWFSSRRSALGSSRSQVRKKWGILDNEFVFLYVGKFSEIKRPADFLTALTLAHQSDSNVKGLMVGDGFLRKDLEAQARASSAPVCFTGFLNQTEVIEAYLAADCFVLPGRETWGLVVNEAMACGLPCITSDEAGCGVDMIAVGKNGFVFKCGNPADMSEKMLEWKLRFPMDNEFRKTQDKILQKYSCERAMHGILQGLEASTAN